MKIKRRLGDSLSLFLLILGNIHTSVSLSEVIKTIDQNLECTHGFDVMFCEFEAQNCADFNLTLRSDRGFGEEQCNFKQCSRRCCCFIDIGKPILGETYTATVLRGGESKGSKTISITASFKPKVPTITSVKESNGNFQVMWKTNMISYNVMNASVTYRKKGDTENVTEFVIPTTVDGLSYYEILGQHLEPSTTYMVSVKSHMIWSEHYSESSKEVEFTTPASPYVVIWATIVGLSVAAVTISAAVFGCYVKIKSKWWDTVAKCPNPKLLDMHPREQEFLKPVLPVISSICVEPLLPDDNQPWSKGSLTDTSSGSPQQSSGISTASSCLSYANTQPADIIAGVQEALDKTFANISPISPLTTSPLTELNRDNLCGVRADGMSSGSSGFDNKSYSLLLPSVTPQITAESSEVQTQAEMLCDSAYRPSENGIVMCADQQVPDCLLVNLSPVVSSLMPTDMSYQQCNADSGRFSYAEDSSLSSNSSDTNTVASCDPVSRVEAGCESSDELDSGATKLNGKAVGTTVCDENPCYGCVPTVSHSFLPVCDDYQAFQNLVDQPDVLLSEKRSGVEEEPLSKYPEESFSKMPPSFLSPLVQGGQCLSEPQRPFLSLFSADHSMPVSTDSGYQSV